MCVCVCVCVLLSLGQKAQQKAAKAAQQLRHVEAAQASREQAQPWGGRMRTGGGGSCAS